MFNLILNSSKELKKLIRIYKALFTLCTFLFIFGIILSFFIPSSVKVEVFASLYQQFSTFGKADLSDFIKVFFMNSFSGLLEILLGFTIFWPLFTLVMNGLALGVLIDFFLRVGDAGLSPSLFPRIILALLPHGIIEFPTLIIVTALGVLMGLKIFFRNKIMSTINRREFFVRILKIYLFLIVPLLLITAFVEIFISPVISGIKEPTLVPKNVTIDPKLEEMLLSQEDMRYISPNVQDVSKRERNPADSTYELYMVGTMIYDNTIYQEIKRAGYPSGTFFNKIYMSQKPEFIVAIRLLKFNSTNDAQKFLAINKKATAVLIKDKKIDAGEKKGFVIGYNQEKNPIYMKLDANGLYLYSIFFNGRDFILFDKLVKMQMTKIINK